MLNILIDLLLFFSFLGGRKTPAAVVIALCVIVVGLVIVTVTNSAVFVS